MIKRMTVVGKRVTEENMSSTVQVIDKMMWMTLTSSSVFPGMVRVEKNLPEALSQEAFAVEIEDRLRKLDCGPESNSDVDCRSRFSNNGHGQLKIQVRLKQVLGGLKV
jgi:hypothetical protein